MELILYSIGSKIIAILYLIVFIFIYFIPSFVAYKRLHNNKLAILICNIFLGWTFVGWVISLVWACTDNIEYKNYKYIKK